MNVGHEVPVAAPGGRGKAPVNRTLQAVLWAVVVVVIVGLVAAFARQQWNKAMVRGAVTLDRFNALPDFELVQQSGNPFGTKDLKGKIWLADFIFTTCPGPCPIMSGKLAEVQEALQKANDVKLVSFTVWPDFDTPPVLTNYAKRFGAKPDKWFFLTGNKKTIYDLGLKGFMLGITDKETGREILREGEFIHSTKIALVDRHGVVRGYYDSGSPEVVQKILVDVGNLLREQPGS
jgi:protein SCO1/2